MATGTKFQRNLPVNELINNLFQEFNTKNSVTLLCK